jgi:hypothetical protein
MSGVKFMRYVLLAAMSAFCQAYGPAWTKSGVITVGTTPEWANYTGGAVANFPMLVRLDSSVFKFSEAKAGGADIGFSDAANTAKLAFEIESWDATAGKAAIWVKVPTVGPNAKATIKMFWGNTAATSESNGAGVFSDYLGVWHLSEAASATLNKDASGHAADATTGHGDDRTVTADASVVSVIPSPTGTGRAYNRNGDNQGFTRVDSTKIHLENKSITVFAWIKRDIVNHPGDFFVAQGTQDPTLGLRMGFDFRNKFGFGIDGGQDGSPTDPYTATTQTLDWHLWVGTFNSANKHAIIYMDGAKVADSLLTSNYMGRGFLDFGFAYGPSGEYFHPTGGLDEVRIASSVAAADMIKLSYLNQNANQSLVGYPVPTPCTQSFNATGPASAVQEGTTVTLIGTAKCAERFQWVKVEGTTETPVASQGTKLEFPTRVIGNTVEKYRFKAMYAGAWQQKDISVTVNEAIAEPEFSLKAKYRYDSSISTTIAMVYPEITNKAKVFANGAPALVYHWEFSGLAENVDYLKLEHNNAKDTNDIYFQAAGTLQAKLCIENGGPSVCHQIALSQDQLSVIPMARLDARALELKGFQLTWKADAIIKVWDLRGQLIYGRSGKKGDQIALTPELAAALFSRNHVLKITPVSPDAGSKRN